MDIEKIVVENIRQFVFDPSDDIALDSELDSLGMDSFDEVEFVMAIEEVFDLEIPDSEIQENFKTVRGVVEYVTVRV